MLSAAICTKGGKGKKLFPIFSRFLLLIFFLIDNLFCVSALMSRQFVEMTRIRIEGLLAAFPKLMGSENKQHTFIETESVR